jgi:uncharacterized protein YbbK (DUF523 family)
MESIDKLVLEPVMLLPRCPNCGSQQVLDGDTYFRYKGELVCTNCKCRYYVEFTGFDGNILKSAPKIVEMPDKVDPKLLEGLTVPSIPKELYGVYKEAARCLGADAPKGAAVLCRHVVQLALIIKGVPDKRPDEMVNTAAATKLLSPLADKQCKAATFMGGKAGHPQANWVENVTADDAKQALLVTKRVLLELFYPDGLRNE